MIYIIISINYKLYFFIFYINQYLSPYLSRTYYFSSAMTYPETLLYLYQQLPMFTRQGAAAYKPNLDNTLALCKALGNPEKKLKCIHIAGTNGKGSCSHMLAAVLQEAGYKTGLYTSPHIVDFRERIRINGQKIPKNKVVGFAEKIQTSIQTLQPSFFEMTVAMAFSHFAEEQVDIAIIETGLGGLLDSTNVIKPILSVITNISFDHTDLLGKELSDIASQKAGIIKPNTPVIVGEKRPETHFVFTQKASDANSKLIWAEEEYQVAESRVENQQLSIWLLATKSQQTLSLSLDLVGQYQEKNICTVMTALSQLQHLHFPISEIAIQKGLRDVKKITGLRGRFDILQQSPTLITDVAHNEAGIRMVLEQINTLSHHTLHIITGFVKDKDVQQVLSLFPSKAIYYFTQAPIPRALPYAELKSLAESKGLQGQGFPSVLSAFEQAQKNANKEDIILITGSFFILEEIYNLLEPENED